MKAWHLGAIVLISFLLVQTTFADLLIYEGFDYTPGSTIVPGSTATNSGIGLTDTYPPNAPHSWKQAGSFTSGHTPDQITTGSVNPADSQRIGGPVGNAAALMGGAASRSDFGEAARMDLGQTFSAGGSTVYYSFLMHVSDLSGLTFGSTNNTASNAIFIGLNNTAGVTTNNPTGVGAGISMRLGSVANTYNIGVGTGGSAKDWTTANYTTSDTLLLIAEYQISATPGDGNSISNLWINPDLNLTTAPTPDRTVTASLNTGVNDNVKSIFIRTGLAGSGQANEIDVDEIRVGTTWVDVVPEPGTAFLLGAVGIPVLLNRRHRERPKLIVA